MEIFEIRPLWNDPNEKLEEPVAKATYVMKNRIWKVYRQRADLKWHRSFAEAQGILADEDVFKILS